MKKILIIGFCIMTSVINLKAANLAYDLTDTGTNYLRTTNAPLSGNASFTIELWFNNNNNNYSSYARLIGFTGYTFEIGLNAGSLVVYDGAWRTTSSSNLNAGWHHVAVTNNTSNMLVYVDEVQVLSKSSIVFNFNSKLMYIGCSDAKSKTDRIRGYFDELRVWNSARTLTQINTDRIKQLVGNESGLLAYYKMNNLSSSTSTANNLTLTGLGKTEPFKFGLYLTDYAMNFDVYDDNLVLSTNTLTGTGDFTIELDFKTTFVNTNAYCRLIGWEGFNLEVAIAPAGNLAYYTGSWINTIAKNLNDGKWHHLAVTRSGQYFYILVDNALLEKRYTNINLSGKTYFGGNAWANQPNNISFNGEIDEIKIWNKYISPETQYLQMDSAWLGNEPNLIAYFDMNTPHTSVLNEVSSGSSMNRAGIAGVNNLPQFVTGSIKSFPPAIQSLDINERCGPGTMTLTVKPTPGSTVNWYNALSGGASIGSGNSFNTTSLTSSTTYYVDAAINGIRTAYRTPVEATILAKPEVIAIPTKSTICAGDTVQLVTFGADTYQFSPTQDLIINAGNFYATPKTTTTFTVIGTVTATACTDTNSLVVTVLPMPTASVQKTDKTLTALDNGATYQWLECPAFSDIANETKQSFTPNLSGQYAVRVDLNGCVNTSGCVLVDLNVGLTQTLNDNEWMIYPNPAGQTMNIQSKNSYLTNYSIVDALGRNVQNGAIIGDSTDIDLSQLEQGIYFIQLTDNKGIITNLKFIKQ